MFSGRRFEAEEEGKLGVSGHCEMLGDRGTSAYHIDVEPGNTIAKWAKDCGPPSRVFLAVKWEPLYAVVLAVQKRGTG